MLCRYTRPVHYAKGARVHSPLESCVGILLPVSYTHLDVYKTQAYRILMRVESPNTRNRSASSYSTSSSGISKASGCGAGIRCV